MQALVILSAVALFGQCDGGSCAAPARSFTPQVYSPVRHGDDNAKLGLGSVPVRSLQAYAPKGVEGRDFYVIRRHRVKHNGVSLVVEGYYKEATGTVAWSQERPFNTRALAEAKAARVEKPAAPDRVPSAEPGPPTEPVVPPVAIPIPDAVPMIQNFGVQTDKMGQGKPYTAVSEEAQRFVAEAKASTEPVAGRLHVTIIGSDKARAAVANDLETHPAFAAIKSGLMVQGYKPGAWPVDPSLGFKEGNPSIVIQTPKCQADPKGGRVVFRATDYSMGPEKLAEAIRRADPNYKPSADPGVGNPSSGCPLGFTRDHWALIAVAVLAVAATLFLPKKGT